MMIKIRRGKQVIKEINNSETDERYTEKDDYSNVLNVRVNRKNTVRDNMKINKQTDKQYYVKHNLKNKGFNNKSSRNNENKQSEEAGLKHPVDVSSKFIPKVLEDNDAIYNAFGLSEKDFDEPKEEIAEEKKENIKVEDNQNKKPQSIEEKYPEYSDMEYDNFERIKKKRNIDNY